MAPGLSSHKQLASVAQAATLTVTLPAVAVLPPSSDFQDSLSKALNHPHVQLTAEQRDSLAMELSKSSAVTKQQVEKMIDHQHFALLSGDEQLMVLSLAARFGHDVAVPLRQIVESTDPISKGPLLQARDYKWQTVLDHLYAIGTQDRLQTKSLTDCRKNLLEDLCQVLAHPTAEVSQSSKATCVPAGVAKKLACENPAEYSRLLRELVTSGKAVLRGSRQMLELHPSSARTLDAPDRSLADAVIQDSFMEFANGPNVVYDPQQDEHRPLQKGRKLAPAETSGLPLYQAETLLEAVFGQDFIQYSKQYPGVQGTLNHLNRKVPGLVPCCIDTDGPRQKDGVNRDHFVLLTKIENGRVYFLNSYKGISTPAGTEMQFDTEGPKMVLEDPQSSLMSMSLKDFSRFFEVAYLPATNISAPVRLRQNTPQRRR